MPKHIVQLTIEMNIHEDAPKLRGADSVPFGQITDQIKRTFCANGPSFEGAMSEVLEKATAYVSAEAENLKKKESLQ